LASKSIGLDRAIKCSLLTLPSWSSGITERASSMSTIWLEEPRNVYSW